MIDEILTKKKTPKSQNNIIEYEIKCRCIE